MGRLIDADKLQGYFWDNRSKLFQSKDCRIAIDNAPTVETIPKNQYEARLKNDMVALLTELQLEIEEFMGTISPNYDEAAQDISKVIQQKINALKAESEDNK
jgi:hypothetical protein